MTDLSCSYSPITVQVFRREGGSFRIAGGVLERSLVDPFPPKTWHCRIRPQPKLHELSSTDLQSANSVCFGKEFYLR